MGDGRAIGREGKEKRYAEWQRSQRTQSGKGREEKGVKEGSILEQSEHIATDLPDSTDPKT